MSNHGGAGAFKATERRVHVAAEYLKGRTQAEIGAMFGVTQAVISRDIKRIRDQWIESTLIDFDAAKARELEKTDHLERTYWDAWERSLSELTKTRVQSGGEKTTSSVERTEFFGDPRFLKGVEWCITNRCRILGIYAAAEKEQGVAAGPVVLRVLYGDNGLEDVLDG